MSESPTPPEFSARHRRDYLYAVLNLNKGASQTEINERYRALSLLFHPDKHPDINAREIATEKFLQLQKAYQVLSEPFLRQIYDELGEDGLSIQWAEELRSLSQEELRIKIGDAYTDLKRHKLASSLLPRGSLVCTVDARRLFQSSRRRRNKHLGLALPSLKDIFIFSSELRYSLERRVHDNTFISFHARSSQMSQQHHGWVDFTGTVRHQFSPRFASEATLHLLFPYLTKFKFTYKDGDNTLAVKSTFSPAAFSSVPPVVVVSAARRLFRGRLEEGKVTLVVGRVPQASFLFNSPSPFQPEAIGDPDDDEGFSRNNAPSFSGLSLGRTQFSCGVVFESIIPKAMAKVSLILSEIGTMISFGFEFGLVGFAAVLTGSWSNDVSEVSATTTIGTGGIQLLLEMAYLEQRLACPIMLSTDADPAFAGYTVVIPTTIALLSYFFIIKPRHRARRISHIRAARKALKEDSDARIERNSIEAILRDTARKHMQAESSKDGLVITEAIYGATSSEEDAQDLFIDVTVAVQALVRNSQLYIPGGESKMGVQGFFDPVPFTTKALRVRYIFRGRMHYAEIPDYLPVVLPLKEHRVDTYH